MSLRTRFAAVLVCLFVPAAVLAQCNLTYGTTEIAPGIYNVHISASGSWFTSFYHGGPVELFLNGGSEMTCVDSPCSLDYRAYAMCQTPTTHISATCRDAAGAGVAQATEFTLVSDHHPSIQQTDPTYTYATNGGGTGLVANFAIHAPAAWPNRVVTYRWLPSGTLAGSGTIGYGAPDDVVVTWVGGPPPGEKHLKATITSCGDAHASTIVSPRDNCCCSQGTPTAPGCVGTPISVATGNMRMSDADPLPSNPGLPLSRTYDSTTRDFAGRFGHGFRSLLDPVLSTVADDGDTYAIVDTPEGSSYVFRSAGGAFAQVWPANGLGATLAYDGNAGTYTLHEPQRDIEIVARASDGVPLRYHSRSTGRDAIVSYSGSVPVHVADSWGNWGWTIATDGNGRVSAIAVDGTSNSWQYSFDGSGALTAVSGPNGAAWRAYTYSTFGLAEARDAAGRLIESHDFNNGRATTSFADHGDVTGMSYANIFNGDQEMTTQVTYASGASTTYSVRWIAGRPRTTRVVGSCSGCGVNDGVYAYDNSGNIVREQDARGYITTRLFDGAGRITSQTVGYKPNGCDPETDAAHCRLSPSALAASALDTTPATATTAFAYSDANWADRPTMVTTKSVANPAQSRVATYTYDSATGATLQERVDGWTSAAQTETTIATTALYDGVAAAAFNPGGSFDLAWLTLPQPAGLRRSFDGPRTDVADVTQWVYYPINDAVPALLRGHLAAVRDAVGNVTRFEAYDAFGNATRVVDPNGVATESTYDVAGRLLTSTLRGVAGCDTTADPLCATDLVTQRSYSPALGPLASETKPNGGTTTYEYDTRRRMTAMTRAVSATAYERAEYDYDPATGKRSAERYKSGAPGSWSLARSEAFAYDIYARLQEIDHPDGTKIVYTYDASNNVAGVQDERHTSANTTYSYDAVNRLSSVRQMLGTGSVATAYAYDVAGNLVSVTDPNGNVTSYVHDDLGHLIQQNSAVAGVIGYLYDPAGNLTSTTDANGATTARTYDAVGRVLSATSSCSGWDTEQVLWTYDDPSANRFGIGRLASMTDPSGSTNYAYERRGLLRTENRMIGIWASSTSYAYDAIGSRTQLGNLDYTYDLVGRPQSVALHPCSGCPATPIVSSASYLPFGPEAQTTFANGTQQTKSYDSRYRITENKLTGAGAATIADYTYVTDAAGNITAVHDVTDASYDRTFGYDDLNRLTAANGGVGLWGTGMFSYDAMGNILSATIGDSTKSFTFTGTTPLVASITDFGATFAVHYDAAGNEIDSVEPPYRIGTMAASVGFQRQYSCRNLMAQIAVTQNFRPRPGRGGPCPPFCVTPPSTTTTYRYVYDGRGLRTQMSSDADDVVTSYVYTPELQFSATHNSNGDEAQYVWFNARPVAQTSTQWTDPRFTFADHLGTPLLQTDPAGQVIWRAEYDPYGRLYQLRAGDTPDEQPLRFPGQDLAAHGAFGVEESYNIFRWYRSGWGRYTQPDPIGEFFDLNLYRYAVGNSLRYSDRFGLQAMPQATPVTAPTPPGFPKPVPPPLCPAPSAPPTAPPWLAAAGGWATAIVGFFFGPFVPNAGDPSDMLPPFPQTQRCNYCEQHDQHKDECYAAYLDDIETCQTRWPNSPPKRALCYSSAAERLAACNQHKPLPALRP